jgi:hypothetical protein
MVAYHFFFCMTVNSLEYARATFLVGCTYRTRANFTKDSEKNLGI